MESKLIRLTVLTGGTGTGKTTFLSQLSLDFAVKGVSTLWCSFELKNEVILATMIRQYSGKELHDDVNGFEFWADRLERLPIYFQTFFGSTAMSKIINIIEFSIYEYDVSHIVLDNLQFMTSGQGKGFEKFEIQDNLISQLRTIASDKNVHISLVIHPRKSEDNQDLTIHSVSGTSKATQEADNVIIIQNRNNYKLIDIKKNRYDGEIGKVGVAFNKKNKRFETINNAEVQRLLNGEAAESVIDSKPNLENIYKDLSPNTFKENPQVFEKPNEELIDGKIPIIQKRIEKIERILEQKELERIVKKEVNIIERLEEENVTGSHFNSKNKTDKQVNIGFKNGTIDIDLEHETIKLQNNKSKTNIFEPDFESDEHTKKTEIDFDPYDINGIVDDKVNPDENAALNFFSSNSNRFEYNEIMNLVNSKFQQPK